MRRRAIAQPIRQAGPHGHTRKAGTPTMGGVIVVGGWAIAVGLSAGRILEARSVGFVLAATGLHALIGLIDDLRAVHRRRSLGLTAPIKLLLGIAAAVALFFLFYDVVAVPQRIPFSSATIELPPIATLALVGFTLLATTNSVNLADGLDGLAGGLTVLLLAGLLALSPTSQQVAWGAPMLGALMGFLWVNAHPATIFLGDVGAFGLGGMVAAAALSTGTALFLPLLAGVLVLEAGSVLVQITAFRLFRRRVFKMSPLHHHFEAGSRAATPPMIRGFAWPEPTVVVRFWIVEALFVGLAVWSGYAG